MTTSLVSWLPEVLPYVPGCPEGTVILEIRNSLHEFCTKTQVWKHDVAPFPVVKGIADYRLEFPRDTEIAAFLTVRHKNQIKPLDLKSIQELDQQSYEWRTSTGSPTAFVQIKEDTILLNRIPEKTEQKALWMTLALRPGQGADAVENMLFQDWRDGIAFGAIQRLKEMPKRSWSDPVGAATYRQRFLIEVSRASNKARYGAGGRSISIKMRRPY